MKIKWLWMWVGGSITKVAGTGLVTGVFIVIYGVTPGQAMAELFAVLPPWLIEPWFKLALVIIGLGLVGVSLHFNVWSLRQEAINALAEDLSFAIQNLLNWTVSLNAVISIEHTAARTAREFVCEGLCYQVAKRRDGVAHMPLGATDVREGRNFRVGQILLVQRCFFWNHHNEPCDALSENHRP